MRSAAVAVAAGICLSLAAGAWAAPAHAAGWCGSGESTTERPDLTTGPQFHLVYAVAADGQDDFGDVAQQMANDAASIDAWWAAQDPTRTLRFDTAQFSGCTGVDISFLRLSQPASAFAGNPNGAFNAVQAAVAASPLSSAPGAQWKDFLVYYTGPVIQTAVCGAGEGNFDTGAGLGVVWPADCPDVPTDTIAAHEALHALGALPAGAPHACALEAGGPSHPCDNALDVLYPYASGQPLSAMFLDWNHDDYYGHSGAWDDIQDSPFLHRLDVPQVGLTVTPQGGGSIVSEQPGVRCSAACTTQWDQGSAVALDPVDSKKARFVRWTGACTGREACSISLAAATAVGAVFGPVTISARTAVTGGGRIVCTPACGARVVAGVTLRLRAVPKAGWRFVRWSGACGGARTTCTPATDFPLSARATFARLPKR